MEKKVCTKCNDSKYLNEFRQYKNGKYDNACIYCRRKFALENYYRRTNNSVKYRCLKKTDKYKVCSKCKIKKNIDDDFYKNKNGKLIYYCKLCCHLINKECRAKIKKPKKIESITKTCNICKVEKLKSRDNFYCNKNGRFYNPCIKCKAKIDKKRREDEIHAKGNLTFAERKSKKTRKCKKCGIIKRLNKDNFAKKNKYYNYTCKVCSNKIVRKRYKNDPKIKKRKASYHRNREHNDVQFKIKKRISLSIYASLKRNNSSKNGKSCLKYLPYTIQELKQHIESQFEWWMTWDNWGKYEVDKWNDNDPATWTWQIDHIIPNSTFEYNSMQHPEFQKCWALKNLRPLSAKKNILDGTNFVRH